MEENEKIIAHLRSEIERIKCRLLTKNRETQEKNYKLKYILKRFHENREVQEQHNNSLLEKKYEEALNRERAIIFHQTQLNELLKKEESDWIKKIDKLIDEDKRLRKVMHSYEKKREMFLVKLISLSDELPDTDLRSKKWKKRREQWRKDFTYFTENIESEESITCEETIKDGYITVGDNNREAILKNEEDKQPLIMLHKEDHMQKTVPLAMVYSPKLQRDVDHENVLDKTCSTDNQRSSFTINVRPISQLIKENEERVHHICDDVEVDDDDGSVELVDCATKLKEEEISVEEGNIRGDSFSSKDSLQEAGVTMIKDDENFQNETQQSTIDLEKEESTAENEKQFYPLEKKDLSEKDGMKENVDNNGETTIRKDQEIWNVPPPSVLTLNGSLLQSSCDVIQSHVEIEKTHQAYGTGNHTLKNPDVVLSDGSSLLVDHSLHSKLSDIMSDSSNDDAVEGEKQPSTICGNHKSDWCPQSKMHLNRSPLQEITENYLFKPKTILVRHDYDVSKRKHQSFHTVPTSDDKNLCDNQIQTLQYSPYSNKLSTSTSSERLVKLEKNQPDHTLQQDNCTNLSSKSAEEFIEIQKRSFVSRKKLDKSFPLIQDNLLFSAVEMDIKEKLPKRRNLVKFFIGKCNPHLSFKTKFLKLGHLASKSFPDLYISPKYDTFTIRGNNFKNMIDSDGYKRFFDEESEIDILEPSVKKEAYFEKEEQFSGSYRVIGLGCNWSEDIKVCPKLETHHNISNTEGKRKLLICFQREKCKSSEIDGSEISNGIKCEKIDLENNFMGSVTLKDWNSVNRNENFNFNNIDLAKLNDKPYQETDEYTKFDKVDGISGAENEIKCNFKETSEFASKIFIDPSVCSMKERFTADKQSENSHFDILTNKEKDNMQYSFKENASDLTQDNHGESKTLNFLKYESQETENEEKEFVLRPVSLQVSSHKRNDNLDRKLPNDKFETNETETMKQENQTLLEEDCKYVLKTEQEFNDISNILMDDEKFRGEATEEEHLIINEIEAFAKLNDSIKRDKDDSKEMKCTKNDFLCEIKKCKPAIDGSDVLKTEITSAEEKELISIPTSQLYSKNSSFNSQTLTLHKTSKRMTQKHVDDCDPSEETDDISLLEDKHLKKFTCPKTNENGVKTSIAFSQENKFSQRRIAKMIPMEPSPFISKKRRRSPVKVSVHQEDLKVNGNKYLESNTNLFENTSKKESVRIEGKKDLSECMKATNSLEIKGSDNAEEYKVSYSSKKRIAHTPKLTPVSNKIEGNLRNENNDVLESEFYMPKKSPTEMLTPSQKQLEVKTSNKSGQHYATYLAKKRIAYTPKSTPNSDKIEDNLPDKKNDLLASEFSSTKQLATKTLTPSQMKNLSCEKLKYRFSKLEKIRNKFAKAKGLSHYTKDDEKNLIHLNKRRKVDDILRVTCDGKQRKDSVNSIVSNGNEKKIVVDIINVKQHELPSNCSAKVLENNEIHEAKETDNGKEIPESNIKEIISDLNLSTSSDEELCVKAPERDLIKENYDGSKQYNPSQDEVSFGNDNRKRKRNQSRSSSYATKTLKLEMDEMHYTNDSSSSEEDCKISKEHSEAEKSAESATTDLSPFTITASRKEMAEVRNPNREERLKIKELSQDCEMINENISQELNQILLKEEKLENYFYNLLLSQKEKNLPNKQKKNQGKVGNKNELKKLLEMLKDDHFTIQQLEDLVDSLGDETKAFPPHSLAKYLVRILAKGDEDDVGHPYAARAPRLSKIQLRILGMTIKLEKHCSRFNNLICIMLQGISYMLLRLGHAPREWMMQPLARIYAVFCKVQQDIQLARIFCYDALFSLGTKAFAIIFVVLSVWPEIIPKQSKERGPSDIEASILHALSHPKQPKYGILPHILQVPNLMKNSYGSCFHQVSADDFLQSLMSKLKEGIDLQGLDIAIILLAKNQGWEWTHCNLLCKGLVDILEGWDNGTSKLSSTLMTIKLMGAASRSCTIQTSAPIRRILQILSASLLSSKNTYAMEVQEALVESLICLSRFDLHHVIMALDKWIPTSNPSQELVQKIINFIHRMPKIYWSRGLRNWQQNLNQQEDGPSGNMNGSNTKTRFGKGITRTHEAVANFESDWVKKEEESWRNINWMRKSPSNKQKEPPVDNK